MPNPIPLPLEPTAYKPWSVAHVKLLWVIRPFYWQNTQRSVGDFLTVKVNTIAKNNWVMDKDNPVGRNCVEWVQNFWENSISATQFSTESQVTSFLTTNRNGKNNSEWIQEFILKIVPYYLAYYQKGTYEFDFLSLPFRRIFSTTVPITIQIGPNAYERINANTTYCRECRNQSELDAFKAQYIPDYSVNFGNNYFSPNITTNSNGCNELNALPTYYGVQLSQFMIYFRNKLKNAYNLKNTD